MSKENEVCRYDYSNKEQLLKVLSSNFQSAQAVDKLLVLELEGIDNGETSPDFLEIVSGQILLDCLKAIQRVEASGRWVDVVRISEKVAEPYEVERIRRFTFFTKTLERLLGDPKKHREINTFIGVQRKSLGLANSVASLKYLSDILSECFRRDFIEDGGIVLVNYPGSFNPFPHKGHIEAGRLLMQTYKSHLNSDPRLLLSTVSASKEKPQNNDSFQNRLENMHKGFFNENYTSIIGLSGDFIDKNHRIEQMALLAEFDTERMLRFLLGSDNFIKMVKDAMDGEPYACFILRPENLLFVSVKPNENKEDLRTAVGKAEELFFSRVLLLPKQKTSVSGADIRSLGIRERRKFVPNEYIVLEK